MIQKLFPNLCEVNKLERSVQELKEELEVVRESLRFTERNLNESEADFDFRIKSLRRDHEGEVKKLQAEYEVALMLNTEKAEVKVRKDSQDAIDQLTSDLNEAQSNTAAAESQVEAQELTIVSLGDQVNDYMEVIKLLSSKVPNVDLSKFNVNVDVQPAAVTVTGGKS